MRAPIRLALTLPPLLPALLLLQSCSGGDGDGGCTRLAPSEQGPGDAGHHFPLAPGDRWIYRQTGVGGAEMVAFEVTGERYVDGVLAAVVSQGAADGSSPVSEELVRNGPSGVSVHVSSAEPFPVEGVVPYVQLRWPLTPGDAYNVVACSGIDLGEDLDGDGRPERFDLRSDVSVGGDEAVTVPAGSFTARKVSTRTSLTIRATSGQTAGIVIDETTWLASGVGRVRATVDLSGDLAAEHLESELAGYRVGGVRSGLQRQRTLAADLSSDAMGQVAPPALATLGGVHLLLGVVPGTYHGEDRISGRLLDAEGRTTSSVDVGGWVGSGLHPAVAASDAAFLVASSVCTTYCDALRAIRIGPGGAHLDPPPGVLVADGGGTVTHYPPSVASDGSGWLVAWATYPAGTYAARIGAAGELLGTVTLSTGATGFPSVAYAGGVYLVAFPDARDAPTAILGVRVSAGGTVLDGAPFPISTSPGTKVVNGVGVASDGERFLVVWSDSRRGGLAPAGYPAFDVYAARVTAAGVLLDGPPDSGGVAVNAFPGEAKADPRVAFDGERFVVTWWIDGYWPPAGAYAARVSRDGVLLDGPAGGTGLAVAGPAQDAGSSRARYPGAARAGDGDTLLYWDGGGFVGAWYAW